MAKKVSAKAPHSAAKVSKVGPVATLSNVRSLGSKAGKAR